MNRRFCSDMNTNYNSTNFSPNSISTQASLSTVYGILAPIGVTLLVAIIILVSYFFADRRRNANLSIRLSGATAPSSDHDTDDEAELGLDEATILCYPMLLYCQVIIKQVKDQSNASSSSSSSSYSTSCSICLTDYKEDDTVRILPECKHFFHVKCLDPWLKLNSTCPICRKPLVRRHLSDPQSTTTTASDGNNSLTRQEGNVCINCYLFVY